MKLIVQPATKNYDDYLASSSGFLFGLKNFSSGLSCTLSLEEIERIKTKYPTQEIFVAINKMIYDEELDQLKAALIKLDQLKITGVFFYDLAVLALKQELGLQVDLVWNNTHMVTNANTCNYYVKQGVKYGLLSSEITLDEMVEINNKTTMQCMVLLVGYPIVALSKRSLLSNFYHFLGK